MGPSAVFSKTLRGLGLAACYFVFGKLSLWLAAIGGGHAAPVWIPSGIAFVAFLLTGRTYLPYLWLASFAVNISISPEISLLNLSVCGLMASGNMSEAYLAKWILIRGDPAKVGSSGALFEKVPRMMRFLGGAVLGSVFGAVVGFVSLWMSGKLSFPHESSHVFLAWWVADALGIILYAPLLLLLVTRDVPYSGPAASRPEQFACFAAKLLIAWLVFGPHLEPLTGGRPLHFPISFLFFPVMTWATFRMGNRQLIIETVALAGVSILSTRLGLGPFAIFQTAPIGQASPFEMTENLFLVQLFLASIAASMFVLKASLNERQASMQLLKEREALMVQSAKMTTLGQLASGIAHEINNPLGVIAGYAKILKNYHSSGKLDEATVLNITDKIEATVERIVKIVRSLRNLTRNESGEPFIRSEVAHMVSSALELCQSQLRSSHVEIKVLSFDSKLAIDCHPTEIEQVFMNLISNSCDAMAPGELPGKWIEISVLEKSERIQIHVSDSGRGVPEEIKSKLFDPFFTTKGAGKGTGLGLNISMQIIAAHQGKIWLDNRSKETCFILELPRSKLPENQVQSLSLVPHLYPSKGNTK